MKIVVVGYGKLGTKIIDVLTTSGHNITLIDKSEHQIKDALEKHDIETIIGNGKSLQTLKELDFNKVDYLVCTTESDEKNIVIASFAKKLGCPKVIARVREPEYINQLEFVKESQNIDEILNPDFSVAIEMRNYIIDKYSDAGKSMIFGGIHLIKFEAEYYPELFTQKMECLPDFFSGTTLVAVLKNGKVLLNIDSISDQIIDKENEFLFVLAGDKESIAPISKKVSKNRHGQEIKKLMIAGGGKTAFYLAKNIEDEGVAIKIIEPDKKKCQFLSTYLNQTLVINGDPTDIDVLHEEDIDSMDCFVAATPFDEDNLLLSLLAKQHKVEDVITKTSRDSYSSLIETLGIDMQYNPVNITSAKLSTMILQDTVKTSKTLNGQAEIIDFIATNDMAITGKSIKELKDIGDIKIIGISRNDHPVLNPINEKIIEGDRVVVLGMFSSISNLERIIKTKKHLF